MGVAGCGKTSIGEALSQKIDITYIDGDNLHPQSNIEKMSSGQPLTDEDRWPWLNKIGEQFAQSDRSLAIGCSALKSAYRRAIETSAEQDVLFVHLSGSRKVIEQRMGDRSGHFMPLSLLDSQFEALEELGEQENGFAVDIDQNIDAIVDQIIQHLQGVES